MPDLKIHHLQKNKYSMFKSLHLSRNFYSLYFNFSNFASGVRHMKKNNLLSQSVPIMASHLSHLEAMKVFRCQENEKSAKMFWQDFSDIQYDYFLKNSKEKKGGKIFLCTCVSFHCRLCFLASLKGVVAAILNDVINAK